MINTTAQTEVQPQTLDEIFNKLDLLMYGPDKSIRSFIKIALDGITNLPNFSKLNESEQLRVINFFERNFACIPDVNGTHTGEILKNEELVNLIFNANITIEDKRLAEIVDMVLKGSKTEISSKLIATIFRFTFHKGCNLNYPDVNDNELTGALIGIRITNPKHNEILNSFKKATGLFNEQ